MVPRPLHINYVHVLDFADIKTREVDIESPLSAHPSDPTVYYLYRFPMSCGELCFNGSGCGACEEEGAE